MLIEAPEARDTRGEKTGAPAVTRAVAILDLLAEQRGGALPLTEIARALGIAKSSTSNLCAALEEGGLIQRGEAGYRLGRRTVELGGAYLSGFDQVREFYRVSASSPALANELVQIAVLDGTDVLYLARHEGRAPLRLTAGIGDRYPAALTAVGNALLTQFDEAEIRRRFADPATRPRVTEASVTDLDGLVAKVAASRERGYGLDEGEMFPTVTGAAVLVTPRNAGDQSFALGASMMGPEARPGHRAGVIEALHEAARALSNPMNLGNPKK